MPRNGAAMRGKEYFKVIAYIVMLESWTDSAAMLITCRVGHALVDTTRNLNESAHLSMDTERQCTAAMHNSTRQPRAKQ